MWIVLLIFLLWNGLLWLVLGGLFAPVLPGKWRAVAGVALLLVLPILVLAQGFSGDWYPSALTRVLVLRPFWYGQLFLPLVAAAGLLGLLAGALFGAARKTGRRAVGVMGLVLFVMVIWGYVGTRSLVVRPLDVHLAELPAGLEGMRIVQLSDLHVGPHTPRRQLKRIAEAVREARPDLIVLTGDQVDDFARDVEPLGRALGGLSAPLGVIAIAGNHDIYAGWTPVRKGMEQIGWKVLVNEAITLEHKGTRFWVAGTGDPAGRGGPGGVDRSVVPDIARTLASVPRDAFILALAHNPELWPELAARRVDLTLSGHTHYGQVAIPRWNWSLASVFLKYAMGIHRQGNSVLYISPGTNYWGIPLRIGTLPEVTVVTLRRGSRIEG